MLCTLSKSDQCAPTDDLDVLGTFVVLIHPTDGFVSIDPGLNRNIHFCVGSRLCVPSFLVTNELHIQNTFTSTPSPPDFADSLSLSRRRRYLRRPPSIPLHEAAILCSSLVAFFQCRFQRRSVSNAHGSDVSQSA